MATLLVDQDVIRRLHQLPQQVQRRLADFVTAFQKNPFDASWGFHSVAAIMVDNKVRSAKITHDYRAIVVQAPKGDTYALVYVDKHDDAYQWASRKQFAVHPHTGMFQIIDMEKAGEWMDQSESSREPLRTGYILDRFTDTELFQAGVPMELIPAVRAVRSDADLENLGRYLPPDSRDVLLGLAAGLTLDEALEEMLAIPVSQQGVAADPDDFTGLRARPQYRLVFVENQSVLQSALNGTLEDWRIFLHPCQRHIVEWKTAGPIRITGSAGTGKTVALIHRAIHLARTYPNHKLLLTTFTTTMAVSIRHLLDRIDPVLAGRIDVTHLHTLSRTICSRVGWTGRIAAPEDIRRVWDLDVFPGCARDLPLIPDEIRREFDELIDPNGIVEEDAYLTVLRPGRPRLKRADRKAIWPLFVGVRRGLQQRNMETPEGLIRQARLAVERDPSIGFDHVLVDEVQDFSLEALRLIRSLCRMGTGCPDPLCLAGDGQQRVFQKPFPLSRAGIDVRGRSRRLRLNYRTSEEIRRYAQQLLDGAGADDLDGEPVRNDADHSVFHGPAPTVVRVSGQEQEVRQVVDWVRELTGEAGLEAGEICITPYKAEIDRALNQAGFPVFHLQSGDTDPGQKEIGVRMAEMKRIKGLEYRAVIMACGDTADPMAVIAQAELLARCERYVAATRAREFLRVTLADVMVKPGVIPANDVIPSPRRWSW